LAGLDKGISNWTARGTWLHKAGFSPIKKRKACKGCAGLKKEKAGRTRQGVERGQAEYD